MLKKDAFSQVEKSLCARRTIWANIKIFKMQQLGTGVMHQLLEAHVLLTKNMGLVPAPTSDSSQSPETPAPGASVDTCTQVCAGSQVQHTFTLKLKKKTLKMKWEQIRLQVFDKALGNPYFIFPKMYVISIYV